MGHFVLSLDNFVIRFNSFSSVLICASFLFTLHCKVKHNWWGCCNWSMLWNGLAAWSNFIFSQSTWGSTNSNCCKLSIGLKELMYHATFPLTTVRNIQGLGERFSADISSCRKKLHRNFPPKCSILKLSCVSLPLLLVKFYRYLYSPSIIILLAELNSYWSRYGESASLLKLYFMFDFD